MIAKKTNVPIVVTTITGADKIHKNFPFKLSRVNLKVLKVIYPSEFQDKTLKDISDNCYQMMLEAIQSQYKANS